MTLITISGSTNFVEEIIKNWDIIKVYLWANEFIENNVIIIEGEHLKADAQLNIDDEVVIMCDRPTLEKIRILIRFVKAQLSIKEKFWETLNAILRRHSGHIGKLILFDKKFLQFFYEEYKPFMIDFIKMLSISLQKTIALESLSDEERVALENVEGIKDPLKENIKELEKMELYKVVADNLWRKTFGWRVPDFIKDKGVDVNGIEELFETILNALKSRDYTLTWEAAYAITEFSLRIFGIDTSGLRAILG